MGDPVDSEDDEASADAGDDKDGCGCATTATHPAQWAWTLPLMGLIGLRRRQR
jgi:MYXO-CTERM domain-containing protein